MTRGTVAVFGASGAIGKAICEHFVKNDCDVLAISRGGGAPMDGSHGIRCFAWDITDGSAAFAALPFGEIASVVWAQGANCTDDIFNFDISQHEKIYAANVTYILTSLQGLLHHNKLAPRARLCVISSIWQNIARQQKLSYCISKSALIGLVQSLAIDLGKKGFLVNAVLPGALDTPMTRANLSSEQIQRLENMTPLGHLSTLSDVCNTVGYLCSEKNTGITGQFIAADGGFSYARIV